MSRIGLETGYDTYVVRYQFVWACFFMPAFFVMSGYCSNFDKSAKEFWKGNLKGIIIPYITMTAISCLPELIQKGTIGGLINSFAHGNGHCNMWFLFALLGSKTMFYYLRKIIKDANAVRVISLVFLVLGVLLQQLFPQYNLLASYHALIALFFVSLGYDMKKNQAFFSAIKKHSLYLFPLVILIMTKTLTVSLPTFTANIKVTCSQIPIFIIVSILGTMFTWKMSELIKTNKILEYAGRNSLIIYGLHMIPMLCTIKVLYDITNANSSMLNFMAFIFLLYSIVYIFCYAMAYLFSATKLKVLMGK